MSVSRGVLVGTGVVVSTVLRDLVSVCWGVLVGTGVGLGLGRRGGGDDVLCIRGRDERLRVELGGGQLKEATLEYYKI